MKKRNNIVCADGPEPIFFGKRGTPWTTGPLERMICAYKSYILFYALLSVEVDILFSPQPIGSEHENRDLQHLSHHKAVLNLPRSLAQVSQARTPRQKAQKRSSVKEQRIFRATRVGRLRKEFVIMFSVVNKNGLLPKVGKTISCQNFWTNGLAN